MREQGDPKISTTDIAEARASVAIEENPDELSSGHEIPAKDLTTSLRQLLDEPRHEIENLIGACERLRETLQIDADCIERSVVRYAKLSRHVMGVTGIIHEAVEKILSRPDAPAATNAETSNPDHQEKSPDVIDSSS